MLVVSSALDPGGACLALTLEPHLLSHSKVLLAPKSPSSSAALPGMGWLASLCGIYLDPVLAHLQRTATTTPPQQHEDGAGTRKPYDPAAASSSSSAKRVITMAVLLDGDGDYFARSYLVQGSHGGVLAALDLRNKLHSFVLRRERELSGQGGALQEPAIQIVVDSFMNKAGLAQYLGSKVDLDAFIRGFNSSGLPVAMVDAGSRDQAADTAIKARLPVYLAAYTYVAIGGSHDAGYAASLAAINPERREKVFLLRTSSIPARSILDLGLEEVPHLEKLFERVPAARTGNRDQLCSPVSPIFSSAGSSVQHQSARPPVAASFLPLIKALKTFDAEERVEWSRLCSVFDETPRRPFTGRLKVYLLTAQEAGIVQLGTMSTGKKEKNGVPWVALSPLYQTCPRHEAGPSQAAIPPKFLPLLETILTSGSDRPLCHVVAEKLRRRNLDVYVMWKMYLAEALALGIVETGPGPSLGSEYIAIKPGLVLPPLFTAAQEN